MQKFVVSGKLSGVWTLNSKIYEYIDGMSRNLNGGESKFVAVSLV